MDYCSPRTRRLAQVFRGRGVKVIIGGLFPTLNPDYFSSVADAVVVGEAEPVMPRLLADLERNRLSSVYRAGEPADLSNLPVPRYDLVETDFRVTMVYEATRGCPFQCGFCVLSAIPAPYRRRPIKHVIRDLRAVPSDWNWLQRSYVGFYDNNLGADRAYFSQLCEAMRPLKRIWGVETSIDTITPQTARQMGSAGARFAYIGLESLSQETLRSVNKRHNRVAEYRRRIGYLHDNGVIVMSIFLIGLDGETPEHLHNLPDMIVDVGVDVPVFTFAVPVHGTPFFKGLQEADRLKSGDLLDGMDGIHLLYRPNTISAEELELGMFACMRRAYSLRSIARRLARRMPRDPRVALSLIGANLFYRGHQLALADCGTARVQRVMEIATRAHSLQPET
jgi:radical SAM superfamily enzyme YgiQ (UPF0313 family)